MFALTAKQLGAQAILAGLALHIMLFGGSRSGKTFLLVRAVVLRALKAPNSRHAIFRFRQNSIISSIVGDTFPKVMRLCFAGVEWKLSKTFWYVVLPNGAEIWFSGLDDEKRVEKILGMEFVTLYFNECSQIPYESRNIALTRLAQKVDQIVNGQNLGPLQPRAYYDENPPSKAHWTYKLFVQKLDPETKMPVADPRAYAAYQINPTDNAENIDAGYLVTLNAMSARMRKRFRDGEFGAATPGALFTDEIIEKWRVGVTEPGAEPWEPPQFVRVVVAVDPSGSGDVDNADNDEIGITVVGLGVDGVAYLLEDCTIKAGPGTWGRVVTTAYDRHEADCVVGEINYGGAMVGHTIQTARPRTPFKMVTATRGKHVRAEPFSSLYEQGKVRHVGNFPELETELTGFNTNGYVGTGSPNRADALIWALTELFPGMVKPRTPPRPVIPPPRMTTAFNRNR